MLKNDLCFLHFENKGAKHPFKMRGVGWWWPGLGKGKGEELIGKLNRPSGVMAAEQCDVLMPQICTLEKGENGQFYVIYTLSQ